MSFLHTPAAGKHRHEPRSCVRHLKLESIRSQASRVVVERRMSEAHSEPDRALAMWGCLPPQFLNFELGSNLRASKFHEFHLHTRLSTSDCRSDRFRRRDLHRRRGHLRMLDFHAFRSPHVVEMKMEGFCEVPDCV